MIDAERFILMAGESLQRLNIICRDLMEMRIPSDAPRE